MSATNVARAGKRGNICVGNNVSATMCPRLPVPLEIIKKSKPIPSPWLGIVNRELKRRRRRKQRRLKN